MADSTINLIVRHKFIYLLVSLSVLFLIHPLLLDTISDRAILHIFFSVVLLFAVFSVSHKGVMRIIALVLLVCALIGTWFGYIADRPIIDLGGTVFKVSFLGFILILIATDVFEQEIVTVDTISGAICIYLLIGLMWAELYSLIEFIQPGSFTIQKFLPDAPGYNPQHQNPLFLYYSFVTLTTLGYGDITPLSPPARAFSFLEAVVGQIFVAVMIARLVGLHIAHSSKKDSA